MSGKMFFGGMPTGPDVDRLMKRFGVPEPGLIGHEEIEESLGLKRTAPRYRTVVRAWRARLEREHKLGTAAEPALGIRVLSEPARVDHVTGRHRGAARHAVRVYNETRAINVAKLDDPATRKYDHLTRATAMMAEAAVQSSNDLRKALKASSLRALPRPEPPAENGQTA